MTFCCQGTVFDLLYLAVCAGLDLTPVKQQFTDFEKVPSSPTSILSVNVLIPISTFVTWDVEDLEVYTRQEEAVQNLSISLSCSRC